MEEKLLATLVNEFTKALIENSKTIFQETFAEFKSFIGTDVKKYLEKQKNKIAFTKTLFYRTVPIYFYKIYQPAKLSYEDKVIDTTDIQNVFNKSKFVTVIGDAGSGKSMLITHLFLSAIKEKFSIPVIVELRSLNDHDVDIENYIKGKIFNNRLAQNDRILEKMLCNSTFTFFLDGYDEIKSDLKAKFVENLNLFIDKYLGNYFLLTSRPYSNVELLPRFHNTVIRKLTPPEIEQFVKKQQIDANLKKNIIDSIKDVKVDYIESFLANPLLLSLYILTFSYNPSIPNRKYVFYRRVLDVLFKEHDSLTKVNFEREMLTSLNQEQFEEILKMFSYITYFEDVFDFERDYLNKKLNFVKEKSEVGFENNKLISDLKNAVSLWVDDSGIISFAHRSLQEYFAALYIQNMVKGKDILYMKMHEKLLVEKKRKSESSNFLSLCEEMDRYYYYKYFLLPAFTYINEHLKLEGQYSKIRTILTLFFDFGEFDKFSIRVIGHNDKYDQYTFCIERHIGKVASWFFDKSNANVMRALYGTVVDTSNLVDTPNGVYLKGKSTKIFKFSELSDSAWEILSKASIYGVILEIELTIENRIVEIMDYLNLKEQTENDFINLI